MYELLNIQQTKSARGKDRWKFSVRFTLAQNLESVLTHGWAYSPDTDQLSRPTVGNKHYQIVVISPDLVESIRQSAARHIIYQKASFDLAAINTRAEELLNGVDPRTAFNELHAFCAGKDLTVGQIALLTAFSVLAHQYDKGLAPIATINPEDETGAENG